MTDKKNEKLKKKATLYVKKKICKKNVRNGNIFLFKKNNFVPNETD